MPGQNSHSPSLRPGHSRVRFARARARAHAHACALAAPTLVLALPLRFRHLPFAFVVDQINSCPHRCADRAVNFEVCLVRRGLSPPGCPALILMCTLGSIEKKPTNIIQLSTHL